MHTVKGDPCFECKEAYDDAVVGKVASPAAFAAYMKCRTEIMEAQLAKEADAALKIRVAHELEVLRQMSEEEREVRECRAHVTEHILNLRCPRCQQVFLDFTGCFALTCTCGCGFCGWCLQDCGNNAHGHVRACPRSVNPGSYYGTEAQFKATHRERRRREVQQYLASLDPALAARVREAMHQDLQDLEH